MCENEFKIFLFVYKLLDIVTNIKGFQPIDSKIPFCNILSDWFVCLLVATVTYDNK